MNNSVYKFYNSKGRLSDSNGNFYDTIAFEDLRKGCKKYLKKNRLRLLKHKEPEFTFERLTISEIKLKLPKAELIPFRFLSVEDMRSNMPNNFITKFLLKIIIFFNPHLSLFLFQYYLIRLKKL